MKNLAFRNKYKFIEDKTKFLSNSLSQIIKKNRDYKYTNVVEGVEEDFSFSMGFYDIVYSKSSEWHSLFILKNTHIDLPCFYTQKYYTFSEYAVKLTNKTNFYIIGRPEKLIKILFTTKVCEAITRIYKNSKCLYVEGVGEYLYLIYKYHLRPEEFENIKNIVIDLFSLFVLNDEFNTDHIDSTNLLEMKY